MLQTYLTSLVLVALAAARCSPQAQVTLEDPRPRLGIAPPAVPAQP
jgi:hypothetical protein